MLKAVFSALTLSMLVVMGCSKETEPAKTPGTNKTVNEETSFKLEIPTEAKNIAKGGDEMVTIGVDRGDDMKGAVALSFKPPTGITIEPATTEIPADKDEVDVTVKVSAEAAAGEKSIPVTGKAGDKETSGSLMVEITE